MTNEETKLLAQVGTKLEILIERMADLSGKMDDLQKTHVMEMNSRMAVAETKISRLENIIYGLGAIVVAQIAAIVFQYLS